MSCIKLRCQWRVQKAGELRHKRRQVGAWAGVSPPQPTRKSRECCELPSGVHGGASTGNILAFWRPQNVPFCTYMLMLWVRQTVYRITFEGARPKFGENCPYTNVEPPLPVSVLLKLVCDWFPFHDSMVNTFPHWHTVAYYQFRACYSHSSVIHSAIFIEQVTANSSLLDDVAASSAKNKIDDVISTRSLNAADFGLFWKISCTAHIKSYSLNFCSHVIFWARCEPIWNISLR